jgi:hypothetical protein
LDRLEKELDADTENSLWTWAIVGSFVLCIAIWRMYGWKGAVAGVILVIICLAVPQGGVDQRLYRKYVQMPLLRYVLQAGVSREHIIEAMRKRSATTDVRRFHHDVAVDDALTLAHRLVIGLRVRKAARNATYVRPT